LSDRSVRSLVYLQANASTARTVNLVSVWKKHRGSEGFAANPFFVSQALNRSILVKHRLRQNERDLLPGRTSATKVILPIDVTNLAVGARSFFVNQAGYGSLMAELGCGVGDDDSHDDRLLQVIDRLPSLDPFLMRERLKKEGFNPDRCYFDLTEADASRMFNFLRQELAPLIGMSFDDLDARLSEKTTKLATKILANASDAELDPLRQGMGMSKPDFEEGVFCWKGFIYYKWTLNDLLPQVRPVASQISAIRPSGPINDEERAYIVAVRDRLTKAIARACETVRVTLRVYDDAYADLTRHGRPQSFRDFLLKAPGLFYELGERLGGVQHIISFWRFRFPDGARREIATEELCDLFADFEASLSFEAADAMAA
jgi:hypothetical protein